ncbi:hypothetical protein BOTCAL_0034g00290 [Botryotinia calthae]|uniref:Uncharacterized protein n=1 Tax=Botryotinia calthae TaxID=38488 RepID=A0A4Y8DD63_9HELO|nr:hypothetical protein BOTCAL_0034g00290 [Botryotinia calthae]
MDYSLGDSWFEKEWLRKELLTLQQLRKQNSAVDDTFFPYGLVLADIQARGVQPVVYDQYTVGFDVERTVTYVSAALDYIKRKSKELQTDAWLCVYDRRSKQLSWSHTNFVLYRYNQQVAEQRIGRILMNAKIEQLKMDADKPGAMEYRCAVANAAVGSPISKVAYPPKVFHSLPETQYESLVKNRAVSLAPKRVLGANLPSQQTKKRSCLERLPDNVHVYYPRDFTRVLSSQGSEGCTQIAKEAIPSHSIQSAPIEGFASGPGIISADLPLKCIEADTPLSPHDSIEIKQKEFQHYAIPLVSSGKIGSGPKVKNPPHFAIQLSSPGGFGSGLDLTKN